MQRMQHAFIMSNGSLFCRTIHTKCDTYSYMVYSIQSIYLLGKIIQAVRIQTCIQEMFTTSPGRDTTIQIEVTYDVPQASENLLK